MGEILIVLSTQYSVLRHYAGTALLCAFGVGLSSGQVFDRSVTLPPAEIDQLDAASAAHLENARRFLAEGQWSEAVESIRRVQETEPWRLVRVDLHQPVAGFERYVTAGEYCQWRLAALAGEAPEALAHYRRLVDALAETWLREGEQNNDEVSLRRVVEQAFASRWGDDALLKLGDLALARGDYVLARECWRRIDDGFTVSSSAAGPLRAAAGWPLWLPLRKFDFAGHGLELSALLAAPTKPALGVFPDSEIDRAAVRARLVLVSILEGSAERAQVELAVLRLLHPENEGQLAGRRGKYADLLASLLEESADWPQRKQSPDWTTLGGDAARGKRVREEINVGARPLWTFPLPRLAADKEWIGAGRLRAGDDAKSLLAYHPVVMGQTVLLRADTLGNSSVVALDLKTGRRLWQADHSRGISAADESPVAGPRPSDAHADLPRHIGVARYTLTAEGSKVFARMGSPITAPASRRAALWLAKDQGFLLGLDLAAQGRPLEGFPIRPPSNEWTFEGPPLCDRGSIYVVMRRVEGARSQLYLTAFELQTTPIAQQVSRDDPERPVGRMKWRTKICSAASVGGGDIDQLSQLLVSRSGNRLFVNTSAGAVAALDADDGRILWLVKYPRASLNSTNADLPQQHWLRDLTPCLAWKDLVIVAPADCERIFALSAMTGELAWTLAPGEADDAVHLLGVDNDTLLISGDWLYWIDAYSGRVLTQFPHGRLGGAEQAAPSPRGLGRGFVAGEHIWWPTRESIFVFQTRPSKTDFGWQPRLVREIPLVPRGVTGGNLVLAGGVLLIASGDRLVAFGE